MVFSGLSSLVIDDVTDLDGVIVVRTRTAGGPVPCPRCGGGTAHDLARRFSGSISTYCCGRPDWWLARNSEQLAGSVGG